MRSVLPFSPIQQPTGDACEVLAVLLHRVEQIFDRLAKLEVAFASSTAEKRVQAYYSTSEAAKILGLAEFTVRNYCRLGRIRGEKKGSGRGKYQSWVVSRTEIERMQREGLLPMQHTASL